MPLSMGVPVGQDLKHTEGSSTLRWRDGRWETHVGLIDKVKKSLVKSSDVIQIATSKAPESAKVNRLSRGWKVVAGASVALVVCALAVFAVVRPKTPLADDFSQVLGGGSATIEKKSAAIRTVDEPWIRQAPEQSGPVEAGGIVPSIPGPGIPVGESRVVASVQVPPATPEALKDKSPVDVKVAGIKPGDKKAGVSEAVVLDMEPTVAVKSKDTTGVQITAKTPNKDAPKAAIGSGLVAVTPDGKTALFTNAATRLPEKFGVGDKLPSGEIIKSIDAKAGIIKTDAKEYRLE